MTSLLDLAVMERDLSIALCEAESEPDAVRATLSGLIRSLPESGVAVSYTGETGGSVESYGPLGTFARDAVCSGNKASYDGKTAIFLPISEKCGLVGRFSFVTDGDSVPDAPISATLGRATKMLSAALCRISSNRRLNAVAKDRELLVREMRHRMRNSLQLIQNSTTFLLGAISDLSPEVLSEIDDRIGALVVVHDMLGWTESTGRVSAETYFLRLAEALRRLTPHGVGTFIAYYDAEEDVSLPVDRAATIGLIVHELVVNTAKHAGDRLLRMSLRVDPFEDGLRLRYEETPVDSLFAETTVRPAEVPPSGAALGGSGLEIVRALIARARGRRLDDGSDVGSFAACFPVD